MHSLSGALNLMYVPARVICGASVAHMHSFVLLICRTKTKCRTFQYNRTLVSLSVSLWNNPSETVFDGVVLAGFKSNHNLIFLFVSYYFLFFFFPWVGCMGLDTLSWLDTLSVSLE